MQNPSIVRTRSKQKVAAPAREIPWSFVLLVIVCASVVAAGFFFAARQHFTSMEYGIKNSKLREQLESLEAEKRRLLLAREVALSPLSVRKAAQQIGLRPTNEEIASIPVAVKKSVDEKKADATTVVKVANAPKADAPRIVPAVMTAPVEAKSGGDTRRRVVEPKKEKKDKVEVAALLKFK